MSKNEVLTDEEIARAWVSTPDPFGLMFSDKQHCVDFVRAIEQAVLAKLTAGVELPEPFGYAREWQGDVSDLNNWLFETDKNECDDEPWATLYTEDQVLEAIASDRARLEADCTRSHPHEDMSAMCELRTEIARLTNENARLKADRARLAGQEPVAFALIGDVDERPFNNLAHALSQQEYYADGDIKTTIAPLYAAPVPAQVEKVEPVAYSGADEEPPVFGRRWSIHPDGFGLQRDDTDGNYVHIDDAMSVLQQWLERQEKLGIDAIKAAGDAIETIDRERTTPPTAPQSLLDAAEKALTALEGMTYTPDSSGRRYIGLIEDADVTDEAGTAIAELRAALQEHGRKV